MAQEEPIGAIESRGDAAARALFDLSDDAVCLFERTPPRPDGGRDYRYLAVNPAMRAMLGGPDPTGRSVRDSFPGQWYEDFDRVLATGTRARLERRTDPQGEVMRMTVSRVAADGGGRLLAVIRDVTADERADRALRDSQERFRTVGESIDAVFYLTDLDRGRLLYISPSYESIWGRPVATLMADLSTFLDTILPEDVPIVLAGRERQARGEAFASEYRIVRPDGETRWIRDRCFPLANDPDGGRRSAGTATDITVQKRAAEALRASEERFGQFAASSSDGLWIRDADTLWMEYTSPAIAAIYGVAPDALLGDPDHWTALILPEDRQAALAHIERARDGGAVVHEFRIRRPADGALRWIRNTDFPLHDEHGRVQRIGGIAEDVTDAKSHGERQAVLLAELQHRVRNILAVVRSVFERTLEAGGEPDDIADHFTGRLDSLARTQVIVSRSAGGMVDLENLIRDELLSVGVSDGPNVTISGPDVALPPIAAESIGLAIHELTTNALKYGALKVAGSQLFIGWTHNIEHCNGSRLDLTWTEQGVPAVDVKPGRRGFGTELIEEALPYRLGADTSLHLKGGGVCCTISVPLRDDVSVASFL